MLECVWSKFGGRKRIYLFTGTARNSGMMEKTKGKCKSERKTNIKSN